MLAIIAALLPVFLAIAAGYALRHAAFDDDDGWRFLDRLNYFVLFPALLTASLGTAELGTLTIGPMIATLMAGIATVMAVLLAIRPTLGLDGPAFSSVFQGASRWNTNVALAAAAVLYGEEGIALVAVAIIALVPLLNVACVTALSVYGENGSRSLGRIVRSVVTNPLILACALGGALNGVDAVWQTPVGATVEMIGATALPLGLLSVGAALDPGLLRGQAGAIAVTSALKLIGLPVIMAGWAFVFGLSGLAYTVTILCAAVPGATASYVLARQMGGDAPLMAALTTASTLAAMITMPTVLGLMG